MNPTIDIEPPNIKLPSKVIDGMRPIHPNLPQIPFFTGIIGPRHRGKTVLLFNLLQDYDGMYGNAFRKSNIVFYSPTKDKDPTLASLHLENVYGPPTSASWLVDTIQAKQQQLSNSNNMTGVLLVFDDITQIRDAWKPLESLSYYGRHDHIHVLYVAHKMSSIPRGVRTQTQQWIIYKPHEESEHQWILDMFSRKKTTPIWEIALERAWNIKYNFVYIDFEREDPKEIYRSSFNDPLFTDEELNFLISSNGTKYFNNIQTTIKENKNKNINKNKNKN